MQIHKNELSTGILVLVTLGVSITILVVIGMPGVLKPLNTYRIYYDNANGIRPGAPVLLAGREIGKVMALESPVALDKRPKDHADYEVLIDVQVTKDAKPIFYSFKIADVDGQRIAKARQGCGTTFSGCGEAASRIVGGRPAPAARMAGRASPQRVLRKMKLWP